MELFEIERKISLPTSSLAQTLNELGMGMSAG